MPRAARDSILYNFTPYLFSYGASFFADPAKGDFTPNPKVLYISGSVPKNAKKVDNWVRLEELGGHVAAPRGVAAAESEAGRAHKRGGGVGHNPR